MSYRIMRLDYWDYRHPTEHVFATVKEADEKCEELQRVADQTAPDPLSCYIVVPECHAEGQENAP